MAVLGRRGGRSRDEKAESRYRRIVEGALDHAIFTTDAAGIIDSWSPGAAAIFGWGVDEIMGRSMELTFTPEDRAAGLADQERIVARAEGVAPDVRWHLRKDGSRVFIDGTTRALQDPSGRVTGFVKVGQDVTERRLAEDDLRDSEAGLRNLAETLEARVAERTAELSATNRALLQEIRDRESAEAARRAMFRLLVTAEENERGRLSRELHDHLGQQLTGLMLGMRVVENEKSPEVRSLRIRQLSDLASSLARDLHMIALELRPPALDNLGLERALRSHLEEWSDRHGIACEFKTDGLARSTLSTEVETTLYRIVQEGLTNVLKHAKASRVSLVLEHRDGRINAVLEDNGIGFDVEAVAALPDAGRRLGLGGIRERLMLLGGELEIETSAEGGTTLFARIPLERALPVEGGHPSDPHSDS